MNKKLQVYLTVIFVSGLALFFFLLANYYSDFLWFEFLFFTFLLFGIHNITNFINYKADSYTSINIPILLPAIIVLGPFWAAVSFLIGSTSIERFYNFVWYKFLFNRTMFFISAAMSAIALNFAANNIPDPNYFVSFLIASIAFFSFNQLLFFFVIKFSNAEHPYRIAVYLFQLLKSAFIEYGMALLFFHGYLAFGKLFLLIALLFIYLTRDFMYTYLQQTNTITQVIESFLKVIDSKDNYTEGHCQRVAEYTEVLSEKAGISTFKANKIINMAKIHDIGKIKVPDKILKSSSSLTEEEYREMQNHSKYGYEILNDIEIFQDDLDIIKHHHERYDGTGYPEGLSGKDIPLGARVISVCDAFDVMTTGRKYKPALTKEQTVQEIKDCSGTQFDPELAGHLVELIREGVFEEEFQAEAQQLQQPVRRSQRYGQAEIRNGG